MSARDELLKLHAPLTTGAREQPEYRDNTESALYGYSEGVEHALDTVWAKGYRKPTILGYLVVGRDGGMVTGSSYPTRTEAQTIADEWTAGAKRNQIDWEYRVAEIVEATR